MAADKRYARLGLFLVITLVLAIATGVFFIQRSRSRASIPVVTYITENVSGLDISSPVRYRGVLVGRVTDIGVDPNTDAIEVDFELYEDRLATIGADVQTTRQKAEQGFPRMRARVIGNPVTGEGYLLLDVPANPPPPPALGFTPDRAYIASMPSPLSRLESRLPEVIERAEVTLNSLTTILARIPDSLDRSDRFFSNVERIIVESQLPELSADLRALSTSTIGQMTEMRADMDRLIGPEGSLVKFAEEARDALRAADAPGVAQAARDSAERTNLAVDDLRVSLRATRDTLQQLRDLARQLDEQPESLIYGPRPARARR